MHSFPFKLYPIRPLSEYVDAAQLHWGEGGGQSGPKHLLENVYSPCLFIHLGLSSIIYFVFYLRGLMYGVGCLRRPMDGFVRTSGTLGHISVHMQLDSTFSRQV